MTGALETRRLGGTTSDGAHARRLAIFTSHPIQYQAPYFRALASSGRVEPTTFFGSRHGLDVSLDSGFGTAFRWDVPLMDGYQHVFVDNVARHPDVSRFSGVRTSNFRDELVRGRFDALLALGWQTVAHVQAMQAAWSLGIPVIVRGESTLERTPVRGARGAMRRLLWLPARQKLYAAAFDRVAAFLAIGTRNRDYYRSFGVPDEKVFWAPYGVDNSWFTLSEPARRLARGRIRDAMGVGEHSVIFASSAKLIERKRPTDLLDAVANARGQGVPAHALFIGDGELRALLEARASERGIRDAVTIAGFINQAELPAWYAAADALVLPSDSRETWGLVVNEAMAAGLPVVVSDAAGCAPDLVDEGANGWTYACGDVAALTDRLTRLAALGPDGRAALGRHSRAIVARFGIDVAASATVAAAESVISLGRGRRA